MILPRDLALEAAHNEATMLEGILETDLGGMIDALIHVEPCIDPECPVCGYDPCALRQAPMSQQNLWHRESLTSQGDEEPRETAIESVNGSKEREEAD